MTGPTPRVGVSIPPPGFDNHTEAADYLAAAADAGLDHVFTADHVAFLDGRGRDGLITVAWLAGLHPTIGVYVGVYLLALRHPASTITPRPPTTWRRRSTPAWTMCSPPTMWHSWTGEGGTV